MQEHVSFIILNYCSTEVTVQCVESIEKNINYQNYSIVIVDNGSTNNSGKILEEKYHSDSKVVVLCLNKNEGFARGNNVGYECAKKKLNASYMIITNSDTIFIQPDFIEVMKSKYKEKKFAIAGPDIITPSGIHQNPRREQALTYKEVKKQLFVKNVFLKYFKIKKQLHLDNKIQILEKMYEKKDKKSQADIEYKKEKSGIVLLGACLIFSPHFIENEEVAFSPKTFMYGEEDLMTYLAQSKNYKIWYLPELKVTHLNGEITKKSYRNTLDKNIFMYTYMIEGYRILLHMMKNRR